MQVLTAHLKNTHDNKHALALLPCAPQSVQDISKAITSCIFDRLYHGSDCLQLRCRAGMVPCALCVPPLALPVRALGCMGGEWSYVNACETDVQGTAVSSIHTAALLIGHMAICTVGTCIRMWCAHDEPHNATT